MGAGQNSNQYSNFNAPYSIAGAIYTWTFDDNGLRLNWVVGGTLNAIVGLIKTDGSANFNGLSVTGDFFLNGGSFLINGNPIIDNAGIFYTPGGDPITDANGLIYSAGSPVSDAFGRLTTTSNPPATATSAGTKGAITFDATHIYVCVATNTWVRAVLATF